MAEQDLQAEIESLKAQLAAAQSAPDGAPIAAYPRLVYRAGGKKGQIDVPGNDIKRVETAEEHEVALSEGWEDTPVPHDPDAEPEPAPKKNGRGKK